MDGSHIAQGLLVSLLDERESRKRGRQAGRQAIPMVASEKWFIPCVLRLEKKVGNAKGQ